MNVSRMERLVEEWIHEIEERGFGEEEEEDWGEAFDDAHGGSLPIQKAKAARTAEVGFMENRKLWSRRPVEECRRVTGKDPVSTS